MSLKDSHLLARRQDLKEDVLCVHSVLFRGIQIVFVCVGVLIVSYNHMFVPASRHSTSHRIFEGVSRTKGHIHQGCTNPGRLFEYML